MKPTIMERHQMDQLEVKHLSHKILPLLLMLVHLVRLAKATLLGVVKEITFGGAMDLVDLNITVSPKTMSIFENYIKFGSYGNPKIFA